MLWGKNCTNLGGLLWFQTKTTNIFEHLWCFFWIALKVWLNICSQTCIPLETLIEILQSNLHTPWNFDWKFAVKLSYPPESLVESLQSNFHTPLKVCTESFNQTFIPLENLQWKFQWNFQPNLNYNCSQNAGLKVSVETFKGPWNFHWNFQCKLSGGYESLTANFQ